MQLSRDPEQALEIHAREELGIDPDDLPSPLLAAVSSFASFALGALLPVLPYLLGATALWPAVLCALIGLFACGALVARVTARSWWYSGLRQLALGAAAAAVTYGLGRPSEPWSARRRAALVKRPPNHRPGPPHRAAQAAAPPAPHRPLPLQPRVHRTCGCLCVPQLRPHRTCRCSPRPAACAPRRLLPLPAPHGPTARPAERSLSRPLPAPPGPRTAQAVLRRTPGAVVRLVLRRDGRGRSGDARL